MRKIVLAYQRSTEKEYRARFLLAIIWFMLFCPKAFSQQQTSMSPLKVNRPNIVIIMADDLDSRQLSCYGGENLQTTHIDRLAKEGLKFNNLIASEAMCVPTRASLFTGLYPARHGAYQNHKPVKPNLKSVAHYLTDAGYRVGLTGKDHVTKPRNIFPFEIIPGFQENCVASQDDYSLDSVEKFVDSRDEPFCLFVMSINPHTPWNTGDPTEFSADDLKLPKHWVDTKQTREDFRRYLAEIRRLDNQVGDVMKMLQDKNILDNTIVIFLGEQGPQFPGGKWTLYDNGQKSSMIVRWPAKIKGNTQTDAIVQYEDILPTLIDIAGGQVVDSLDGRSFYRVLENKSNKHRDFAFGIHNNIPEGPAFPMRSIRDNQYKLILNLTPESEYYIKYMMNLNNDKLAYTTWVEKAKTDNKAKFLADRISKHPFIELYDLKADPSELKNLADNPKYELKVKEMKSMLQAWMQQQGDPGASLDVPMTN